ncbi:MAG: RMD1 family protein [Cryobacterium sp.]|nr:RMD1 family protein [Oligoflexia bacterium]
MNDVTTKDPQSGMKPDYQVFRLSATHVAERLKLKELREKVIHPVKSFTNYELVVEFAENTYAFIYNYGSVVFYNVPDVMQEKYLAMIRETKEGAKIGDTTDVFLVEYRHDLEPTVNQVFHDRIASGKITFQKIKIICMLVAESAALDYYDLLIENLLERATVFTKRLEQQGRFVAGKEDLLKFVGMCLSTKQEIISNLYIVDSPEETWDSPELDKIYHELKSMLEIDVRYRAVEYKSKIIQESIEVITELVKTKREVMLELTVILLIAFEILFQIVRH